MTSDVTKKRIFHIAKELNISHNDIISFLKEEGVSVGSLMSEVEIDIYEKILGEFSKEKLQIDRFRKEQARKVIVDTRRKKDLEIKSPSLSRQFGNAFQKLNKSKQKDSKVHDLLKDKIKKEAERLKHERESNQESLAKKKTADNNKPKVLISDGVKSDKKTDFNKEKSQKGKITSKLKLEKDRVLKEILSGSHKLKEVDISKIADKINKVRKVKKPGTDQQGVKTSNKIKLKQPLPVFDVKTPKKKPKKTDKNIEDLSQEESIINILKIPEFSTIDELSQSMGITSTEVIMACMKMGMMVTINQRLDMDSLMLIADEFNFQIETGTEFGDDILENVMLDKDEGEAVFRPPVVTVMGHVDHGKTSLLDYIRDTSVVAGESGGITQHIGAYEVTVKEDKKITFIDTPGHEAFTAMRARGAQVTDIVVIVVAADDAVMPQTIEAIHHAKAADVPMIIAINKIDRTQSDIEKIKRELSEENILVEEYGGKVQCSNISAKTGDGISELLDKILLEAEVLDLKAIKDAPAKGTVIESRLDKGLGPISTILIEHGTVKKGDIFVCGTQFSKVRSILNERNQRIDKAYPSDPVQILGFDNVPNAGDKFVVMSDDREARKIALGRSQLKREAEQRRFRYRTLEQIGQQISEGEIKNLDIIIKGDVDGSIEALSDSLMALSFKEVAVNIIHRAVGMITENDVRLSAASNAVIIAFHVNTSPEAKVIAKRRGIDIRNYSIIYDAVDDVKLALEGLLAPKEVESALGIAEVRNVFKVGRRSTIAGSYIKSGKAIRNAKLRIKRDDEIIHEGLLTSLKRFKEDASEVLEGYECGIAVDGFNKFNEGDIIEFYEIKEVKRKLLA